MNDIQREPTPAEKLEAERKFLVHAIGALSVVIPLAMHNVQTLARQDPVTATGWQFAAALLQAQAAGMQQRLEAITSGIVVVDRMPGSGG